jgi:hypothetical protein
VGDVFGEAHPAKPTRLAAGHQTNSQLSTQVTKTT